MDFGMASSPEFSASGRKEQLLEQSPLLKNFLDFGKIRSIEGWIESLSQYTFMIEGEIDDNLGVGFTDLSVDMLLIGAKHQNVFRTGIDTHLFSQVAKSLFLIGHEIGDFNDANLFLSDIMVQLQRIRVLHPWVVSDSRIKEKTIGVIRGFLDSGAYIREYYFTDCNECEDLQHEPKEEAAVVPDFIKNFINQIPDPPDLTS